jgi:hypothetical protein
MRIRPKSGRAGALLLTGLALAGASASPSLGADAVLYFKNGRALRVVDYRTEGEWLFFMVSPPPPPSQKPADEEDTGPSEMGIRRSLIDRIETPHTARTDSVANTVAGGGGGGGAAAEGPRPASGGIASTADLSHVPTLGSAEAAKYGPKPVMPQPDISKSGAGHALQGDLRNAKVPHRILKQAQEYQAQVKAARELKRQQQGATTTPSPAAANPAPPLPVPAEDPEGPSS